jgi:hypothetical protein
MNMEDMPTWMHITLCLLASLTFWFCIAYLGMQYQAKQDREHPKTCKIEIVDAIVSAHYRGVRVRTKEGTLMPIDQPMTEIGAGSRLYICRRNNTEPYLEHPPNE